VIRYAVEEQVLLERINQLDGKWLDKAAVRTQAYIDAHEYTGGTNFWADIKKVYIELQHEKCAYCETKLQGAMLASKVHEVEHYRPKQSIKAWPNRTIEHWREFTHDWPVGEGEDRGYYKLAYHPLNYAIACTRCNSTLKANYFPIRGRRDIHGEHPRSLADELPLLLYPISDIDRDDPSDIITFEGVLAVPVESEGPRFERAVTNIAFFQLNHEDLPSRRASELVKLWPVLNANAQAGGGSDPFTNAVVQFMCGDQAHLSACMRAFKCLHSTDPDLAREYAQLAGQMVFQAKG
jgi:hypothetical protein